jgi:DNA-directed RNA polymerase specialized sigma24 family protein
MSKDELPGDDEGQDELYGAFAALGGRLTWDEFMRLPGSGALVRRAALLLDGDTAAAEDVVQDSFAALQDHHAGQPHVRLLRSVVNRSRRYRAAAAVPGTAEDAGIRALLALPNRSREAVVLHDCMGLPETQAAEAMGISAGAFRSHLARGTSSLKRT